MTYPHRFIVNSQKYDIMTRLGLVFISGSIFLPIALLLFSYHFVIYFLSNVACGVYVISIVDGICVSHHISKLLLVFYSIIQYHIIFIIVSIVCSHETSRHYILGFLSYKETKWKRILFKNW